MTQSLEKIIRREKFNPSIIGFFINHNFLLTLTNSNGDLRIIPLSF